MKWKARLKQRKLKKGKNISRKERMECRLHGRTKYGLLLCSYCNWPMCPLCYVRCSFCRQVFTNHPVLGKLDKYVGKVGYWSESQIEDYEKGYAKDE